MGSPGAMGIAGRKGSPGPPRPPGDDGPAWPNESLDGAGALGPQVLFSLFQSAEAQLYAYIQIGSVAMLLCSYMISNIVCLLSLSLMGNINFQCV